MEFRILGSFEVVEGDRRLELGPPKQRAVLAVLAVAANRVVSLDRLIDELWGEVAPAAAIGSLQAYVSNLRRVLEPDRPPREPARVLVTQAPGYVLRVEPEAVDAARFEAAAAEGRRLLEGGRAPEARARLEEALGLWRGPALADFAYEGFAQAEAARLEELRLGAAEDRLQACLDAGEHASVVAEAEALVAAHPLRERLWGLVMVGLYRCGRQADALRAYQTARTTLGEELGIEPGPTLRRLEADILSQAPSLEWRPPPESGGAPAARRTVMAVGPSPPSATPEADEVLVGREAELARLEAALASAAGGRGGAVLVAGEPGIGKTRLVEELAARAEAAGAATAWGAGLEGGGTPAYWPWVAVVRALLGGAEAAEVAAGLGPGAAELAQVVPEVKEVTGPLDAPPAVDPETARLRLFEAVAGLIEAVGQRRPLVVVLDDLQWADVASLGLVGFLAPRLRELPLVLLGTYRPAEVGPAHPLTDTLAALARHQVVERIELQGLSPADVAALLEATTGEHIAGDVLATVVARTEGNPFFVGELARLLAAEGLHPAEAATALPAGVRDVLRRRLGRLPEQTTAVLSLAALVGRDFDLDVLETAAELDPERTLELVEAGLMSGLLIEHPEVVGRFRFSHDLVRETVAGELTALRQARLHARLARAQESLHGDDPNHAMTLAHHYFAAAPVLGPEAAIGPALRAAEVASARLAHEQAEEQLRRALELVGGLPPGPEKDRKELGVLLSLAQLLSVTQGFGARETGELFTRARGLSLRTADIGQTFFVVYGVYAYELVSGRHRAARPLAEELLALATSSRDPVHLVGGHQAVGIAALHQGDFPVAHAAFEQALSQWNAIEGPKPDARFPQHPVVACLDFLAWTLWHRGDRDRSQCLIAEARSFVADLRHDLSTAHHLLLESWILVVDGDSTSALAFSAQAVDFAEEKRFPFYAAMALALHGWAVAQEHDPERGIATITEALSALNATGAGLVQTFYLALLAEAQRSAERPEDALASVDRALERLEPLDERFWEPELHRLRGELLLEVSPERAAEAQAELEKALEVAQAQGSKPLAARALESLDRFSGSR